MGRDIRRKRSLQSVGAVNSKYDAPEATDEAHRLTRRKRSIRPRTRNSKTHEASASGVVPPTVPVLGSFLQQAGLRPLQYQIPDATMKRAQDPTSRRKAFWSHTLYHGPMGEDVQVHYCTTLAHSESVAQRLLSEKVLGFDLEWKPLYDRSARHDNFKQAVSLIQLASESEIGLFHIAMHPGQTPQNVIAPSLKEILESSTITKTGVAIVNADGRRLETYLGLKPRGLFELSHLHGIVKEYPNTPATFGRALVSLARQVQSHLLLPLLKGRVRTSDWSKSTLTAEQIQYAASDAYAGYMLYQVMDLKRRMLNPVPALPPHSELHNFDRSKLPDYVDAETSSSDYSKPEYSPDVPASEGRLGNLPRIRGFRGVSISRKPELHTSERTNLPDLVSGESSFQDYSKTENSLEVPAAEGPPSFVAAHMIDSRRLASSHGAKLPASSGGKRKAVNKITTTEKYFSDRVPDLVPSLVSAKSPSEVSGIPQTWDHLEEMNDDTKELLQRLLARRAEVARINHVPREIIIDADDLLKLAIGKPKTQYAAIENLGPHIGKSLLIWEWVSIIAAHNHDMAERRTAEKVYLARRVSKTRRRLHINEQDKSKEETREQALAPPTTPKQAATPVKSGGSASTSASTTPIREKGQIEPYSRRLGNALLSLRTRMALKLGVEKTKVARGSVLGRIASAMPQTKEDIVQLKGVADFAAKAKECEVDLLVFIKKHSGQPGLVVNEDPVPESAPTRFLRLSR